jgi:hypothetical protein
MLQMKCLACDADLEKSDCDFLIYKNTEFPNSHIFEKCQIIVCPYCGFGFLDEEPSAELINNFYINDYRDPKSPYYVNFAKYRQRSIDARSLAQIYMGLSQVIFSHNDNFLDLGSGLGNSFATASLILDSPNCFGIEMNSGAQEFYLKNYNARSYQSVSTFIDLGLKAKMILLSHSLEHFKLTEIPKLFEDLKMALSQDGVIIIEVPNEDLLKYSKIRKNDAPHLLFFNRESLMKIVTNYGFEVTAISECGNRRNDVNIYSESLWCLFFKRLISRARLARYIQLGERALLFSLRSVLRNYEVNRKEQNRELLKQFSQSSDRDCLRIAIKLISK